MIVWLVGRLVERWFDLAVECRGLVGFVSSLRGKDRKAPSRLAPLIPAVLPLRLCLLACSVVVRTASLRETNRHREESPFLEPVLTFVSSDGGRA